MTQNPAKTKKTSKPTARRASEKKKGTPAEDTLSLCKETACETPSQMSGYCRLHYIKHWRKIKRKEQIFKEGKLNQYIEELVAKHPEKYIEAIRQDLANNRDFTKVIYDLDLDENMDDFDGDNSDSVDHLIDGIKRDFDDDSEIF